jgi:hypothetical protein
VIHVLLHSQLVVVTQAVEEEAVEAEEAPNSYFYDDI